MSEIKRQQSIVGYLNVCAVAALLAGLPGAARADDASVTRGKYLVNLGGCNDCHTPGSFFGKPDSGKTLGGSEVGFEIPDLGTFYGANLTPDKVTGLGGWSDDQVRSVLTTGKRPDGRELAPIMPWRAISQLTKDDMQAVIDYLRSIPQVSNKVVGPFGPKDKPTSFVMKIVPPEK